MLDADPLLRRLTEDRVDYVIVGGFAVIAHGVVRATKDLDICPRPDRANLERLANALRGLHAKQWNVGDFEPDALPYDPTNPDDLALGRNFQLETDLGRLDIMQWLSGIDADQAHPVLAEQVIDVDWHGTHLKVCSLEHLRAMKRAAGRPQDLQDLADLEIANG